MGNASWKDEERRCGALFGLRRRPLSGNSTANLGPGDLMNEDGSTPKLVFEVKSWRRMPLVKHLDKVERESKKVGKPWAFVIHEKSKHRRYVVCAAELFAEMFKVWI